MSNKVYEIITNKILDQLKQGDIPWRRPWVNCGVPIQNFVSRKPYTGINPFLLNHANYACPYWVTFKQAKQLGGSVKKGEKGTMIVFFKTLDVEDRDNPDETKTIPMLRYYTVFNLMQCDGIAWDEPQQLDHDPIEACEDIVRGYPGKPGIKTGMRQACYYATSDRVEMPDMGLFTSAEEFYCTLFHELGHSTGHENRLNRKSLLDDSAYFGSHEYSKEELIAEFTAAMLCGVAGIDNRTVENSAAYIQNWSRKLKKDPKLVVWAASQAQKAADYIQNLKALETKQAA